MTPSYQTPEDMYVQSPILRRLRKSGWAACRDAELSPDVNKVIRTDDLLPTLERLNPEIAEQPDRATEVLGCLCDVLLSANTHGLLAANEVFGGWMRGTETMQFVGSDRFAAVKLIDFDNPRENLLRATIEATFREGDDESRYDIVLWVNGLPLVVGETKQFSSKTWFDAWEDIHRYVAKTPSFFVPNVLAFATDGRDFRYGTVHQRPEQWAEAPHDQQPPSLQTVMRAVDLLLTPEKVLEILLKGSYNEAFGL